MFFLSSSFLVFIGVSICMAAPVVFSESGRLNDGRELGWRCVNTADHGQKDDGCWNGKPICVYKNGKYPPASVTGHHCATCVHVFNPPQAVRPDFGCTASHPYCVTKHNHYPDVWYEGTNCVNFSTEKAESQCVVEVDVKCIISSGTYTGEDCRSEDIPVEECLARPSAATMRYNGGDCSQSNNQQLRGFSCVDTEIGPPSDVDGSKAYVVVTDAKGTGIVYHSDWVAVGENYFLRTPDQQDFVANQIISIYNSDRADAGALLQKVQYQSSCATSSLKLNDKFGASQIVEFFNEIQGQVSVYASYNLDLTLSVRTDNAEDSATIVALTALTNFGGPTGSGELLDLSDQVTGIIIGTGSRITVSPGGNLDLSMRRSYTVHTTVKVVDDMDSQQCQGDDFLTFLAGFPGVIDRL